METGSAGLRPPPTIRPEFDAHPDLRRIAVISGGLPAGRENARPERPKGRPLGPACGGLVSASRNHFPALGNRASTETGFAHAGDGLESHTLGS